MNAIRAREKKHVAVTDVAAFDQLEGVVVNQDSAKLQQGEGPSVALVTVTKHHPLSSTVHEFEGQKYFLNPSRQRYSTFRACASIGQWNRMVSARISLGDGYSSFHIITNSWHCMKARIHDGMSYN